MASTSSSISDRGVPSLIQTLEQSCSAKSKLFAKAAVDLKNAFRLRNPSDASSQTAYESALKIYEKSLKSLKTEVKIMRRTFALTHVEDSRTSAMKQAYNQIDKAARENLFIQQPSVDVNAIQIELENKEAQTRALQQQLEAAQQRINAIEASATSPSDPSMSIGSLLDDSLQELSNLEDLRKANEEKERIVESMRNLESQTASIRSQLDAANARTEQLERTNAELQAAIRELQSTAERARTVEQEKAQLESRLNAIDASMNEQVTAYSHTIEQTNQTIANFIPPPPPPPPSQFLSVPTSSSSSSSSSAASPLAFLGQIAGGASVLKKKTSWTRDFFWVKLPKLVEEWKREPKPHIMQVVAQVMGWCDNTLEDLRVWMEASKNFSEKLEQFPSEEIDARVAKRTFHKFLAASTETLLSASENDDDGEEWSDDESSVQSAPSSSASINMTASVDFSQLAPLGAGDSIFGLPLASGGYARTISKTELLSRFRSKIEQIQRSLDAINEINQTFSTTRFTSLRRMNKN